MTSSSTLTFFLVAFLTTVLHPGECCPPLGKRRIDAGGFLVRVHIEKDLQNVPASWKYYPNQYPPDYRVKLKYLQKEDRCDPTTTTYREFARQITFNFTEYKNKSTGLCDFSKSLECDRRRRRCDCKKVTTGDSQDKDGPYYLRWDDKTGDCRAALDSFCDRRFKCGGDVICKRKRCVCPTENCVFTKRGYLTAKEEHHYDSAGGFKCPDSVVIALVIGFNLSKYVRNYVIM